MANSWIDFVKSYAKKNNMKYNEALKDKGLKAAYEKSKKGGDTKGMKEMKGKAMKGGAKRKMKKDMMDK